MEKAFLITEESEYYKALIKYEAMENTQRKFVNEFFDEKNIEAKEYMVGGEGVCNTSFNEFHKDEIKLYINPSQNDLNNFGKYLTKPNKYNGLCSFKKNCVIAKEFAQRCIDKQIVINLFQPQLRDYLRALGLYKYRQQKLQSNDKVFLKIDSDYIKEDAKIPNGFVEIKLSEYYKILEEYEEKIKC